jgi:pimeloyl-ACP methyl ester carboxylesterase/DNA-binding CsgD family transcriptional regulator
LEKGLVLSMSRKPTQLEEQFKSDIAGSDADLDSYDTFLGNWQSLREFHTTNDTTTSGDRDPLDLVETFAKTELQKLIGSDEAMMPVPNESFQSLANAAFMLDRDGILTDLNTVAASTFDARREMSVEHVGIDLNDGGTVPEALRAILAINEASDGLHLIQAQLRVTGQQISLAILQLPIATPQEWQFLMIVIDAPWNSAAHDLVRSKFDLTAAESGIVSGFVTGVSLKQIAASRGRSYATVRNQFQSVMEKTGCSNQPDLLRLLLGVSFLLSNLSKIAQPVETVFEKRIELLRPQGRFWDVTLHGDFGGTPVVCLPSLFGQPTTPKINQILHDAGILLIAVARPGFGDTTPEPKGADLYETLGADVSALLDSMGVQSCVFMGRASAARPLVNLGLLIPDRIDKCVLVNGLVPRPFIDREKVVSKWTKSLMSAARLAPSFAGFILGTGKRLMFSGGVEPFIKKMYGASPMDMATVEDPQVADSIRRGVEYVTNQGIAAGTRDMIDGFGDWSGEVANLTRPLVMLHGE